IDPAHPMTARLDREFEPVIALAARWRERTWDDVSPTGRFDGGFVNTDHVLGWVADDGRRRGDDAPVLVAHSTPDFARLHLDDPEAAGPEMVRALREVMGLSEPVEVHVHRWSLARPVGEREAPYALEAGPHGLLGVCGDGWGPSPKVETAWRSGRDLGRALVERLS
ncbi:MAG: protoporphyrinogen oxidase, partial [Nocardioides sp.]|uniref:FAD-dependent oxidoreductase n=1 Tax=Nocardioides sp. TaxID=35761 RepID=UPI00262BE2C7